jgi:hypothetical protein
LNIFVCPYYVPIKEITAQEATKEVLKKIPSHKIDTKI